MCTAQSSPRHFNNIYNSRRKYVPPPPPPRAPGITTHYHPLPSITSRTYMILCKRPCTSSARFRPKTQLWRVTAVVCIYYNIVLRCILYIIITIIIIIKMSPQWNNYAPNAKASTSTSSKLLLHNAHIIIMIITVIINNMTLILHNSSAVDFQMLSSGAKHSRWSSLVSQSR